MMGGFDPSKVESLPKTLPQLSVYYCQQFGCNQGMEHSVIIPGP